MGGSSGRTFASRTPEDLVRAVRRAEDEATTKDFHLKLVNMLNDLLATYNGRDISLVQERLTSVKSALSDVVDASFDQLFGGSVAKHTYVDGLSDIDSLLLLNNSSLEDRSPKQVLDQLHQILSSKFSQDARVEQGRMAVTLTFKDGMILQILPATKNAEGTLRVPSSRTEGWSHIDPQAFRDALTRRNTECAGKLIPTIKLAKAIVGELPESQRLSGYHMESLAIAAFREYKGEATTSAMLPVFFERARELVLAPIRDSTGQSVHVDAYLGDSDSDSRIATSHILSRIAKRMRNATVAGSLPQWSSLFGGEE